MLYAVPRFDEATEYSYRWALELDQALGGERTLLLEQEAIRQRFEQEILFHDLFIFYDHGDAEGLVQQGGQGYIVDKQNNQLLQNKHVYTMCCLWGSDGGIDTWKKGAKAVWTYTQPFAFTTQDEELFREAANHGLIVRIKEGASWEEALEKAKAKFTELIDKTEDVWTKIWLRHDRDSLVCYDAHAPGTSTCMFRRLALRLFGSSGWWPHLKKRRD